MPLVGDTIKLHVEFRSFLNTLIDPTSIILNFYDFNKNLIGSSINIDQSYKVSTGVCEYPYTLPSTGYSMVFYEFIGRVENTPSISRGTIAFDWS